MSKSSKKIYTIIMHEYLAKIRSKGFIISTILGPLFMILVIAVPVALGVFSSDSTEKKLAIIDKSNGLSEKIINLSPDIFYSSNEDQDSLRKKVLRKEIDGYVVIEKDFIQSGQLDVFTRGGGGIGLIVNLEKSFNSVLRTERLIQNGIDTGKVNKLLKSADIKTHKVTEKGTEKDFTEAFAAIGYVLGLMIYFMMLMYGSFVSRAVIEEKANRIIEVIASSAKPFEIMFGKVVGVGMVGLTQVLFWIVIGGILFAIAGVVLPDIIGQPDTLTQSMQMTGGAMPISPEKFEMPNISIWLVLGFIFYFISGYFIYSTLFAAIGSAVDQESDAGQLQGPIMIPIIIPVLFISHVISNPDSMLSIVMSLVPFFTPILMIVRVTATDVPVWQIALSIVLSILTFIGCLWAAAKVYRVGILMYGKKVNLKDLIKWIKISN